VITAFTTSSRGLRKLATSLPCATLVRVPEDLQHPKMRLSQSVSYQAFADEVKRLQLRLWPWHDNVINHKTAIFRQINKDKVVAHHDALEFPDGQIVLLTSLSEGQQATVLQLPAEPKTVVEFEAQRRAAYVG
jgi:hypothetical protein